MNGIVYYMMISREYSAPVNYTFVLDKSAPKINFDTKFSEVYGFPGKFNFTYFVEDNNLLNSTFYIKNQTDILYINSSNESGIYDYSFYLSEGDYFVEFFAQDYSGNLNYSNMTLKISNINVSLVSPDNASIFNEDSSLICSAKSFNELSKLTILVWNSSGSLIFESSDLRKGNFNTSSVMYAPEKDGLYSWNCEAEDINEMKLRHFFNYSLIYDFIAPNLSIFYEVSNDSLFLNELNISLNEAGRCNYSYSDNETYSFSINSSSNFSIFNLNLSNLNYS